MATVEQIIQEPDNYSELSIDASFTLEDILQEPPDQDLEAFANLEEIQNFDAFFDDDEQDQNSPSKGKPNKNQQKATKNDAQLETKDKSKPNNIPADPSLIQPLPSKQLTVDKPLPARKGTRLADLPLPAVSQLRNMLYIALKNVSQLFDLSSGPESKGIGVATCISTSGNKFLAIGTSIGNIVVFEVGVKGHRVLNTADQRKYGQATSLCISRDNRYIVAGYETGLVVLWDLYSLKVAKTVLLQKNRILKVLFCSQNYQNFVSSDSQGYLYMYTIQNYLWTGVKTQLLIDKSDNIYYDIKYSKVKSGRQILALSTLDSVLLIILKPTVAVLGSIERPEGIGGNKIPNCEIGEGQEKKGATLDEKNANTNGNVNVNKEDYVCVSWGRLIYVYTLVYSNSQIEKLHNEFILEQPSGVHNMQFITSGILVTLDNRQVYRVINLETEGQKAKQSDGRKILSTSISTMQLEAETIYQRCLKDKQGKFIKSYSNTVVSCSYNPRYKQIFLISKNSIYRGRLQKWTDYIHYLLTEHSSWQLALKLCLQLYKGNYNIFAQPFVTNKNTLGLLCDIGKIYWTERMKEIEGGRRELDSLKEVKEEVRGMFGVVIEYFCAIDCEDFMFNNIYKNLKEKFFFLYAEQFIECLQPFIQQSLINKIPSRDIFLQIIDHFSKFPQLLNKFIMGLHEDSIYFEDIVEICTREKLFESLSYICSVNGDFISPANKIITHLQQDPHDRVQYANLKQYLTNLIDFKYPNGKPISKNRDKMLSDLSVWLVCDETLRYMVKNYTDDYFLMLTQLGRRLLENQLTNEVPALADQVMSRIDSIRETKLMPMFMQFLVEIGLSDKIHFSQELLKKILDACVEIFDTYPTSSFKKEFKYNDMLKFLQKYLLDKHDNTKPLRDQFETKILKKLNIWVRITYQMIAGAEKEQLTSQAPELLKNQDPGRDASLGYLFENSYKFSEVIERYEDLLIQWTPQKSLLYMIQGKKGHGIRQINNNVMKIKDQKLRYAVTRKILRLLRKTGRQLPPNLNKQGSEVARILKASIQELHIPSFEALVNKLAETTISEQILLFYVRSICKYKKEKRVFYELVQNQEQYRPIAGELAGIIKEYGFRSCMGFIYEQQLKLTEAFSEYQQVYLEYFEDNFKKLISHEYCHGRFMTKIFHLMLDLCFRIRKQQQWGRLISVVLRPLQLPDPTTRPPQPLIIDTIQSIYDKKSSREHPFMQHLLDVIELTLTSMSREVSMSFMAVELNRYTDLLGKGFIVGCLTATLKGCGRRVETYEISRKLMVEEFGSQFQGFFTGNKVRGSQTDNICDQCGLEAASRNYNPVVEQINFEVLKCGHGYHDACFRKNYYKCKICTRKAYGDQQQDQKIKDKLQNKVTKLVSNPSSLTQTGIPTMKQSQNSGSREIYRYLALDDYRKREEENFQMFREQYEGYIATYKNA